MKMLSRILLSLTSLGYFFAGLGGQEGVAFASVDKENNCEQLGHIKRLDNVQSIIVFEQVGCEKFIQNYYDSETRALILKQELVFGPEWKVTEVDNGLIKYTKKMRTYWSLDRKKLIQDYYIDGNHFQAEAPAKFFRLKTEILSLEENKKEVKRSGHDFSRYEYKSGEVKVQNIPFEELYERWDETSTIRPSPSSF